MARKKKDPLTAEGIATLIVEQNKKITTTENLIADSKTGAKYEKRIDAQKNKLAEFQAELELLIPVEEAPVEEAPETKKVKKKKKKKSKKQKAEKDAAKKAKKKNKNKDAAKKKKKKKKKKKSKKGTDKSGGGGTIEVR